MQNRQLDLAVVRENTAAAIRWFDSAVTHEGFCERCTTANARITAEGVCLECVEPMICEVCGAVGFADDAKDACDCIWQGRDAEGERAHFKLVKVN
jgi:hypothetical protein